MQLLAKSGYARRRRIPWRLSYRHYFHAPDNNRQHDAGPFLYEVRNRLCSADGSALAPLCTGCRRATWRKSTGPVPAHRNPRLRRWRRPGGRSNANSRYKPNTRGGRQYPRRHLYSPAHRNERIRNAARGPADDRAVSNWVVQFCVEQHNETKGRHDLRPMEAESPSFSFVSFVVGTWSIPSPRLR